jgi:pyruvate ferredoxin oxidoreductase gamma subunit
MHLPEITEGIKSETVIIVNGKQQAKSGLKQKMYYFDATALALRILGKDIVNTAMLGVFSKETKIVSLDSILKAVGENFLGKILDMNTQLVKEAYNAS